MLINQQGGFLLASIRLSSLPQLCVGQTTKKGFVCGTSPESRAVLPPTRLEVCKGIAIAPSFDSLTQNTVTAR